VGLLSLPTFRKVKGPGFLLSPLRPTLPLEYGIISLPNQGEGNLLRIKIIGDNQQD